MCDNFLIASIIYDDVPTRARTIVANLKNWFDKDISSLLYLMETAKELEFNYLGNQVQSILGQEYNAQLVADTYIEYMFLTPNENYPKK